MRRSITVLILVAIVAAIGWSLWHWSMNTAPDADPWKAMPHNAALIVEVPSPLNAWQLFTGTTQFWGDLEDVPAFARIDSMFRTLADAAAINKSLGRYIDGHAMLLSWAQRGDSVSALVAWPIPKSPEALAALGATMGQKLPASFWSGDRVDIRSIAAFPLGEMAWKDGLLLIASDAATLDGARSRMGRTQPKDSLFDKARSSFSVGSDAHILISSERATRMFAPLANDLFPQGQTPDGWAAMDVRLRPGAVLMNGLLFPAEAGRTVTAIRDQPIGDPDIIRVLPATVCRMRSMHVDKPEHFVQDMTGHATDGDSLFNAYAAWIHGGVGIAEAPISSDSLHHRWAVFQAEEPDEALAAITKRCADRGCDTTSYRGIRVTRLADDSVLQALFGTDFAPFPHPLWTMLSDKVVMANTPADMRTAIDAWVDRNSLALDPRSGDFFQQFGSRSVYGWWADVANAFPADSGIFAKARRGTGGCLMQFSPREDGALVATVCIQHAPATKQDAGALWTTAMGAPLEMPPVLLKDYLSKTLQVLVQDKDHRLTLISCTGKVLWRRTLDGPVLGDIQQVDRYRNGKAQMLLNTGSSIYMVDRLGRDVDGFPVSLKGTACSQLSVFDYEGNMDYRLVVPMADGRLLNYGIDGKPVSGWTSNTLHVPVAAPLEHIRIQGKDFIIAVLKDGNVVVLDRKGEERYPAKLHMNGFSALLGSRKAMDIGNWRLLWADSAGTVLSGSVDGDIDTLSQAMSGTATVFDVDGDGHDEVVRTTSSMVSVWSNGKSLWSVSLPDDPGAYSFEVPMDRIGSAVGVVLPRQGQVRL
ncbi:MAG: hypothetical protein ABI373_07875, partial [Flavobacteriales bacterium]